MPRYVQQGSKLVTPRIPPRDRAGQGSSIAISRNGSVLVVGSLGENRQAGAVFIYTRVRNSWVFTQMITNPEPTPYGGGQFGCSVAVSADGNVIAIGAHDNHAVVWAYDPTPESVDYTTTGAAYVYRRTASSWEFEQELIGSISADLTQSGPVVLFGNTIAMSDDGHRVAVGGPYDNGGPSSGATGGVGGVWVFATDEPGAWTEEAMITGSGAENGDHMGSYLDISADGLTVVSGSGTGGNTYVWVYSGGWSQLTALDGTEGAGDLALSEDGAVLVTRQANGSLVESINIWQRVVDIYTVVASLTPSDATSVLGEAFGQYLAISNPGTLVLAGAPGDGDNSWGAAWLFGIVDGDWVQLGEKYVPDDWDLAPNDGIDAIVRFGAAVDITPDGLMFAVGGPYDDNCGVSSPIAAGVGAAWVFAPPPSYSLDSIQLPI